MKKQKTLENIIAFAVLLTISILFLAYVIPTYVRVPKAATGMFTPRTYPQICFAVIGICSLLGLVKNIFSFYKGLKNDPSFADGKKAWREKTIREKIGIFMPWICIALCALYAVLFSTIGFIWATIMVPPLILIILGDKKPMHFVYVYLFCSVMYGVFTYILGVRLP